MSSQIFPDYVGVALVDDDAMALAHLESYFSNIEDISVLISTRSPHEALRFLQSHQVDVLITDVHMENMSGVRMTSEAIRISPSTRVILLTTVDTDEDLLQGLGAGASGFLLKSAPAEEITAAVRTVHSGAKVVAPMPTTRLIDYALASVRGADGSVSLSDRERDVLHLLCEGASNRKIASLLTIAEATVKSHITGLFHKTGTTSRLEMVVWAFKHGYASNNPFTIPTTGTPGSPSGSPLTPPSPSEARGVEYEY